MLDLVILFSLIQIYENSNHDNFDENTENVQVSRLTVEADIFSCIPTDLLLYLQL